MVNYEGLAAREHVLAYFLPEAPAEMLKVSFRFKPLKKMTERLPSFSTVVSKCRVNTNVFCLRPPIFNALHSVSDF